MGAVISQADAEGYDHPVAYFSRKLLSREQKYATTEKECLAIKLRVGTFQAYLLGQEFIIQTANEMEFSTATFPIQNSTSEGNS